MKLPSFKSLFILTVLVLLAIFCADGCSVNRQNGISVSFDPKTGIVSTNSLSMVTYTTGNAKTAIESQRGSVGKTISIGINGLGQETDMATTIKAVTEGMGNAFESGVKAAGGTVLPIPK